MSIGLSLSMSVDPGASSPAVPLTFANAETETLVGQMVIKPSQARVNLMDTFIGGLKTDSIWSTLKCLYMLNAPDAQSASLNWVSPSANVITTGAGTPSFLADKGYTFNNTNYLDTNFNPTTASISLNAESYGYWVLNNVAANTYPMGTQGSSLIPRRSTLDQISGQCQTTTSTTSTSVLMSTSIGMIGVTRSGSTNCFVYKNGLLFDTLTRASAAVSNHNMYIGGRNSGSNTLSSGGSHQVAMVFMGTNLDATKQGNFYTRTGTYFTAVGT